MGFWFEIIPIPPPTPLACKLEPTFLLAIIVRLPWLDVVCDGPDNWRLLANVVLVA